MSLRPLETYLQDLFIIHSSGSAVQETSYYGTLEKLFNEIGKTLKPKVRCIINIADKGAGLPDGGFFTPDQFQKRSKGDLIEGQLPSRGCLEIKSTKDNLDAIVKSDQVRRYLRRYRQVLVSNYREFILVAIDDNGNSVTRERFALAANEGEFWTKAGHAHSTAEELGARFTEYLKRVMLYAAPLTLPKDVAWFLASYARDASARIAHQALPALDAVRKALEDALGLKFEGEKGEHFFRSTFVQTLFYGIFSSWVLWSKQNSSANRGAQFNWRVAAWSLHVPMIKALFEQVATQSKLQPLGLVEVLDWTGDVLNRVDRSAFFANFEERQAVQYFYEPFLEAFDPKLRKDLGVWYTPLEIVKYMVARVDTVLREELQITDGLADSRVYVLDPCCGTGAYLVEVLQTIFETLKAKGEDALAANDLKVAAMNRVLGFELLPAPFVISHLQLGLLLQHIGAPLSEVTAERVGVYLTNSLTGWAPPSDEIKKRLDQLAFSFSELKEEHEAASRVKQEAPILVILGNPPYNAFAGVSPQEEQGLVDAYKEGLIDRWNIKKFNLDDLYVRFFRLAERRIAQNIGVICYISNFSYLRDPSFVVMRERLLTEFDRLWLDSLNGDSRGTGKLTPEGAPDPSVFSTAYNRVGIRVGTAIALMVRKAERSNGPVVRFRQFWGINKRVQLLASANIDEINSEYHVVDPSVRNRLSFYYLGPLDTYSTWPSVSDLSGWPPLRAFIEARKGALIDIDKDVLQERMTDYYNPRIDWSTLKSASNLLTQNAARFNAEKARQKVLKTESYDPQNLRRYAVRPLETRWCYHSRVRPLWNEPRPELIAQCWSGNEFLVTRLKTEKEAKGSPFYFSSVLVDYQAIARNVSVIPFRLRIANPQNARPSADQGRFFEEPDINEERFIANLSPMARDYLAELGIADPDTDEQAATVTWFHALAIGYAPAFLLENADGIRGDWPRVPLPARKQVLLDSAEIGRKIAALLNTEIGIDKVTIGNIAEPFRSIGRISTVTGTTLKPAEDLKVTAGWGHLGIGNSTMPGKGRILQREYSADERKAIETGVRELRLLPEVAFEQLGALTTDIYLNEIAYWKNVPLRVWDYTIGGYQVIKKWLSYREVELLGRPLFPEEAREFTDIARRICALILLEPALNKNYDVTKKEPYDWNSKLQTNSAN